MRTPIVTTHNWHQFGQKMDTKFDTKYNWHKIGYEIGHNCWHKNGYKNGHTNNGLKFGHKLDTTSDIKMDTKMDTTLHPLLLGSYSQYHDRVGTCKHLSTCEYDQTVFCMIASNTQPPFETHIWTPPWSGPGPSTRTISPEVLCATKAPWLYSAERSCLPFFGNFLTFLEIHHST